MTWSYQVDMQALRVQGGIKNETIPTASIVQFGLWTADAEMATELEGDPAHLAARLEQISMRTGGLWVKHSPAPETYKVAKFALDLKDPLLPQLCNELSTLRPGAWVGIGGSKALYRAFGMRNMSAVYGTLVILAIVIAIVVIILLQGL